MTGRCATCKYWQRNVTTRFTSRGYEYEPSDWGSCELFSTVRGEGPPEGVLAFANDQEEYQADFNAHEDFGCVHHEPKDATE